MSIEGVSDGLEKVIKQCPDALQKSCHATLEATINTINYRVIIRPNILFINTGTRLKM
jgi:hypothetical protein